MTVVYWCLRHPIITLVLIGALISGIYNAVHVPESEHPRPGYVVEGGWTSESECLDEGGEVVDDVCYLP